LQELSEFVHNSETYQKSLFIGEIYMKRSRALLLLLIATVSTPTIAQSENYARAFREQNALTILNDFRDFLSLPNTGAQSGQLQKNAEWIVDYITPRGFDAKIVRADGAPYVIAERSVPGAEKTVLIYVHFDGQQVIEENWASPPFEPTLRAGVVERGSQTVAWPTSAQTIKPDWRLYARSAGDDKGPIIALMAALDAMKSAHITPSVNIKLILDGEEEKGSPSLTKILAAHSAELSSDLILFCDGPMHQSGKRQLIFGARGSMALGITAYGPIVPLHSGHYGNWAPNPNEILMRALLGLKNDDGTIAVEGYYDDVKIISPIDHAAINAIPPIDDQLKNNLMVAERLQPQKRIEELVLEPAIVITGFDGGGAGKKARNIIQPSASASLNFRLVKNQTVAGVRKKVQDHFKSLGYQVIFRDPSAEMRRKFPNILKLEWRGNGYGAFKTEIDSPEAQRLTAVLDNMDGNPTLLTPTMGGSLPIFHFEAKLKTPTVILPIANFDNNQHGRNENIRIQNLWDAIEIYAAVLENYGKSD
jgi:acetylornithine deacetylase/succinyl-diaminopimelate desuccinylase-like protein